MNEYTPLVSVDWVAENGNNNAVRLVEVDVDTESYEKGHISNAVGWNWETQLQQHLSRDLISATEMKDLLEQSGISNDTKIILYGDNNNWFAAWAFWQLKYYGHQDVQLMDGGRVKWVADDKPLTTEVPQHPKGSYTIGEQNPSIRIYRDQLLSQLDDKNLRLVDVRSNEEFTGQFLAPPAFPQEGAQRAGHIPGAKSIPWGKAVNEDGTFKSIDDLEELYGTQDINRSNDVVTYCRIGERAAHSWFVLTQLLGYENVRNYDGSWTEWGSIVGAPIEK
tara:strand:+ start:1286 stop:2119 length:834 start_codon:yes stop_codon:yes gene_type:complete